MSFHLIAKLMALPGKSAVNNLLRIGGCISFVITASAGELQDAINAAPTGTSDRPTVIRAAPGLHRELIYIQREKRFLRLVGEKAEGTILSYDLYASLTGHDGKPIGAFRTASTVIDADDFTAENITFENSALAVRVDGDRVTFRNCRFLGWQDTILDNRGRHYCTNCYIAGAVDFIFGGGRSFFEDCEIRCLGNGYITAASPPVEQPFGFVFARCSITGATPQIRAWLGRPWRPYASVTFLDTRMSEVVRPGAWNNWKNPAREKTARYAEFNSTGPGADAEARCSWAKQLSDAEAASYSKESVLGDAAGWK